MSRGGKNSGRADAVRLYTLGGVRVVRQNSDVTEMLGAKRIALLVYLFHERRPMSPYEIIELMKHGRSEEAHLEGLEADLTFLQGYLDEAYIRKSDDTIEAVSGVWMDTTEVEEAIDGRDPDAVANYYRGDFLAGFNSEFNDFDEWAKKEKARIRRAWTNRILSAARTAEEANAWDNGAAWWNILVSRSPKRAEAVAGLLKSYALAGDEQAASRAYGQYLLKLNKNGKKDPAKAVQEVVLEYSIMEPVLGDIVEDTDPGNRVTPYPRANPFVVEAARAKEPAAEPTPSAPVTATAAPAIEASPVGHDELMADLAAELEVATPEQDELVADLAAELEVATPEQDELVADLAAELEVTTPAQDELVVDLAAELEVAEPEDAELAGLEGSALPEADVAMGWDDVAAELETLEGSDSSIPAEESESVAPAKGLEGFEPTAGEVEPEVGPSEFELQLQGAAQSEDHEWDEIVDFATPEEEIVIDHTLGPAINKEGASAASESATAPAAEELPSEFMDPTDLGTVEEVEQRRPRSTTASSLHTSGYVPSAQESFDGPSSLSVALKALASIGLRVASLAWIILRAVTLGLFRLLRVSGALLLRLGALARGSRASAAPARSFSLSSFLRRFWYAPVGLAVVAALVVFGPQFLALASSSGDLTEKVPELPKPSLPDVSMPKVSMPRVTIPKVTIRTPGFVTRIREMLAGPLLERRGARIIVADVSADEESIRRALNSALRASLAQSTYFSATSKEQSLLTLQNSQTWEMPTEDALRLAQAEGHALVLASHLSSTEAGDSLQMRVLDPNGEELYTATAPAATHGELLGALEGVVQAVRRRMGEPPDEIEKALPVAQVLSGSVQALLAYDQASEHMFAGRFRQAINAANQALQLDPEFAMAHRILADAYVAQGQRNRARSELESLTELSGRLSERERMRLVADLLVFDGEHSKAAMHYDEVFRAYRDDVRSLQSQGLLQRMIGVRGGGDGNLRVAYSLTPVDWPPLARTARFLGYRGRLPDVDSLIAAARQSP